MKSTVSYYTKNWVHIIRAGLASRAFEKISKGRFKFGLVGVNGPMAEMAQFPGEVHWRLYRLYIWIPIQVSAGRLTVVVISCIVYEIRSLTIIQYPSINTINYNKLYYWLIGDHQALVRKTRARGQSIKLYNKHFLNFYPNFLTVLTYCLK